MTRFYVAALTLSLALAAYAHTALKASNPTADAVVAAPKTLELEFAGDVRLTALSLTNAAGVAQHLDAVPTAIANQFALAVHGALTPGEYTVVWRAVGGDTHIVSGEFRFTVAAR
jgi:copper resistance protein C